MGRADALSLDGSGISMFDECRHMNAIGRPLAQTDVATRKKLYAGGADAVRAAKDPLVELARQIDSEARELRKKIEAQGELKQQAQSAIAKARFALDGANSYPDATFTLRLAYGTVQGYTESGKSVPPFTTFAGLYERTR